MRKLLYRHSWINLGSNYWRCTACQLIKHLTSDGLVYYYPDKRWQEYKGKSPECKKINQ